MFLLKASRARIQVPCSNIRVMANLGADKGLGQNDWALHLQRPQKPINSQRTKQIPGWEITVYIGSLFVPCSFPAFYKAVDSRCKKRFQILAIVKLLDWYPCCPDGWERLVKDFEKKIEIMRAIYSPILLISITRGCNCTIF